MAYVKLPPLAVGTLDVRGVRWVRLAHVVDWLEDVRLAVEADDDPGADREAELVLRIAEQLARARDEDEREQRTANAEAGA